MTWLTWRQYRAAAAITAAVVAAFAAADVVTGVQLASQWHSLLAMCTASRTCGNLSGTLFLGSHPIGFRVLMTLGVPAVLGILAGVPLLAHEFETGTNQYAWTQSVTRRRWLAVKAGWLLLAGRHLAAACRALVTWWSGPDNALQANAFDPAGSTSWASSLSGTRCSRWRSASPRGPLLRRTLPAIAVTLGGFIAVDGPWISWTLRRSLHDRGDQLLPGWRRIHPRRIRLAARRGLRRRQRPADRSSLDRRTGGPRHARRRDSGQLAARRVPGGRGQRAVYGALPTRRGFGVAQAHGIRGYVTYQPASRYWAFQGIETGIFLALAAALIAVAFAVVSRRDA